ncbi:hypothetical protein GUJ93_ZPchr0007g5269 [Zizania palustris]|uniref:Uncharacterized protein n=1 Tax=Zizania palustris TaxID=103762 RepID=A0A8J5W691_ZIZPA|nr:hypothetical protein GUJ93_ZPchr0007g5269 [Zizania palustris]
MTQIPSYINPPIRFGILVDIYRTCPSPSTNRCCGCRRRPHRPLRPSPGKQPPSAGAGGEDGARQASHFPGSRSLPLLQFFTVDISLEAKATHQFLPSNAIVSRARTAIHMHGQAAPPKFPFEHYIPFITSSDCPHQQKGRSDLCNYISLWKARGTTAKDKEAHQPITNKLAFVLLAQETMA